MALLVNPSGETVEVDDAEAPGAVASLGYAPATPEQAAEFQRLDANEATYGTLPQQALTAYESGMSALTFGLSDVADRALGASPDYLSARLAREQTNPTASGAGTALGVAVPALLSGGTATAPQLAAQGGLRAALRAGAQATGPGLAMRAGEALGTAAAKALPEAVGPVARGAVKLGVSGATEGGLYGAGQVTREAALGDKNLTAQSAFATVGLSALTGGLAGGTLGAGGGVLSKLVRSTPDSPGAAAVAPGWIGRKVDSWLGDASANAAGRAAGATQQMLRKAEDQMGRARLNRVLEAIEEKGYIKPFRSVDFTLERSREGMKKWNDALGEFTKGADATLPHDKLTRIEDVTGVVRANTLLPLKNNPHADEAAARLEKLLDRYDAQFPSGVTPSDLRRIRTETSDAMYGLKGNRDPWASDYTESLGALRNSMSDELSAAIERAGMASREWRAANWEYSVAAKAHEFAVRGSQRTRGNNQIPLTTVITAAGGLAAGGLPSAILSGAAAYGLREYGAGLLATGAAGLRRTLRGEARGAAAGLEAVAKREAQSSVAAQIASAPRPHGSPQTRVITPQRPSGELARYEVVEADDLVQSHKPDSFAPNPDYPSRVQERNYRSDENEIRKVTKGGDALRPELVLTDTPSATDGPPLVTSGDRRVVLGGNGRTMMLKRAFKSTAQREAYRTALVERSGSFGVSAEKIRSMKAPVLVRVMEDLPAAGKRSDLAAAVRRYNEGLTAALSPTAKAVADAQLMRPSTVASIGAIFEGSGEKSLRDLMRERPRDFIAILQRDGVVNAANRAEFIDGDLLTEEGKNRLEGMFVGRVAGTGERLSAAAPAVLSRVERATPHLIRVQSVNPALDEIGTVQAALDLLSGARRQGVTVEQAIGQGSLAGVIDRQAVDPATRAMAEILTKESTPDLARRFRAWADVAAVDPGQSLMFAKPPSLVDARRALFAEVAPSPTRSVADRMAAAAKGLPEAPLPSPSLRLPALSDAELAQKSAPPASGAAEAVPEPPQVDPETVEAVAAIAENSAAVERKIDGLASTLVRIGVKAGRVGRAEVLAGVAKSFGASGEWAAASYDKQAEEIRRLAASPEAMYDFAEAAVADLYEHAPETAAATQMTAIRAVQFLASKLPRPPEGGIVGRAKWTPSPTEIRTFERYRVAVDDPLSLLKQAAAGTLTPEAVEAVSVVHPELLALMRTKVLEAVTRHPDMPARARLMVSMLVGQDVDGSGALGARNQATYEGPTRREGQQAAGAGAATPARADKLNPAKAALTPMQASAARD